LILWTVVVARTEVHRRDLGGTMALETAKIDDLSGGK
jgi:hypothetical protein